jgi:VIT1/CCC1 family predicted Fe2+/Mn2+ transporter
LPASPTEGQRVTPPTTTGGPVAGPSLPSAADLKKWRRFLADERAEAAVYRDLAQRRTGEERDILLGLADAEGRHEEHWLALLGDEVGKPVSTDLRTRILGFLARRLGSVFVLALAQTAEARSPYSADRDATPSMAADELIHGEVVRALAARGRNRLSGSFRAAVFGANDGLVSNLSLVLGIGATGVSTRTVLFSGILGLLAGALSMGAGEFVSVRSQRELLEASNPSPAAQAALPHLDADANELTLLYRARGMSLEDAAAHAAEVLHDVQSVRKARTGAAPLPAPTDRADTVLGETDDHEEIGTAFSAALSSFCCFASGAIIPVLPYLFGLQGIVAVVLAALLVGIVLLGTGAVVGVLSGGPPLRRALRQLAIGYGAAAATYLLGLLFGTLLG